MAEAPEKSAVELEQIGSEDELSQGLSIVSSLYYYNHWIYDQVRPFLGSDIVEVGAGVGSMTQFMLNARRLVCLEPFDNYLPILRKRFEMHGNVEVYSDPIEQVPNERLVEGSFDSAVCLNVLEHIAEDVSALAHMKRLVKPGGHVIVLVPAMKFLCGAKDKALGHVRRYSVRALKRTFRQAGLEPIHGRYMNFVGALAWWWTTCLWRRPRVSGGSAEGFNRMVPLISAAERIIPIPFGLSAIVVGRRP